MIRAVRRGWNRLLGSVWGGGREGDLAEELASHIEFLAEDNMRKGMTPEEARRQARLRFGSLDATKESYREQRGLPMVDGAAQDLRYAFRGIRRNPGFAAVAVLSLAIGIGANTAVFSLLNSVLLRPLAYREPDRVFAVREVITNTRGQVTVTVVNPAHAREWARSCPSLEGVALMRGGTANVLAAGGEPVSVRAADVPHDLLPLLGVQPVLGRTFLAEEEQEGRNRAVILAEPFWRANFHADPALVGKSIVVDGEDYRVVGVAPESLRLPYGGGTNARFELFRPLTLSREELSRMMGNFNYGAVARVKRGTTAAQAIADLDVVQARFPALAGRKDTLRATLIPARDLFTRDSRLGLWVLAGAVAAVLLIVCINLANLLLARVASRAREAAIRAALGASSGRLFRLVLAESLVLAVAGGVLGTGLAMLSTRVLLATTTLDIPRIDEVRVDSTVLLFAFGLTLATGVLFAALPAWRLGRANTQEALRAGSHTVTEGRGGLRLRQGLIGVEVGLSTAMLIVAALLATSFSRLLHVDKGFEAGRVLTVDIGLAGPLYADDARREKFFDRVLSKAGTSPGVLAAGMITHLPTLGQSWNDPIYLEGAPREQWHTVDNRYASPGYFRAMQIPVRQGRAFDESDRGRGVAVLSAKAAKLLWPGDPNPVGRTFMGEDDKLKTLVGIVAEVRADLQSDPPPTAYYPYWQRVPDGLSLVVRTAGDAGSAAGAIRAMLRGEDAQLPIPAIRTLDQVVDTSVAQRRFQLTVLASFAAAALLVACLGIYGVVAYSVARRRNELGIRMALGAQPGELVALVLRQGMTPAVFGLAGGVAVSLALAGPIRGLLFGVQASDPLTIAGVAGVLLVVSALACFVPARRAANTDAIASLRLE